MNKKQINDCFENFTLELIVLHIILINLSNMSIYYFTPFSKKYTKISHFPYLSMFIGIL